MYKKACINCEYYWVTTEIGRCIELSVKIQHDHADKCYCNMYKMWWGIVPE